MSDDKGILSLLGGLDGKGSDIIEIAGFLTGPEGKQLLDLGKSIKEIASPGSSQGVGQSSNKVDAHLIRDNVGNVVETLSGVAENMTNDPAKKKLLSLIGDIAGIADGLIETKK